MKEKPRIGRIELVPVEPETLEKVATLSMTAVSKASVHLENVETRKMAAASEAPVTNPNELEQHFVVFSNGRMESHLTAPGVDFIDEGVAKEVFVEEAWVNSSILHKEQMSVSLPEESSPHNVGDTNAFLHAIRELGLQIPEANQHPLKDL